MVREDDEQRQREAWPSENREFLLKMAGSKMLKSSWGADGFGSFIVPQG